MSDPVDVLAEASARRFARWDEVTFRALADRAGVLTHPLARDAWLRLVAEGVGCERLGPGREGLLTELLVGRLDALSSLPSPEQTRYLARIWNLSDALAREPEWIEALVLASLPLFTDLRRLEAHLVEHIASTLRPCPTATWAGPLRLARLDPRPLDPDFLPGSFEAIAPRVVAVRDRIREGEALALVLADEGPRMFPLRVVPPRWEVTPTPPRLDFDAGKLTVAGLTVEVPTVSRAQATYAMPGGQALCAAWDSQLLWVATSP